MNVKDLKTRTKVLIVSAGVLGIAGLGLEAANAANAATPLPTSTQSVTVDTPTPGDVADAPGASEDPETADAPEVQGETGPNVEQIGDHMDPRGAPDAP
jgi:hypothetical protein